MWARIYALLFLALAGLGAWYQQNYMQMFSAEFEAELKADKLQTAIIHITQFSGTEYRNTEVYATTRADEGKYFNNGKILMLGDVRYNDYEPGLIPRTSLVTSRLQGQVQGARAESGLFETTRKLEKVSIPNDVTFRFKDDLVFTKNVHINIITNIAETDEKVNLRGPGRVLDGQGLVYSIGNREFRMKGPVLGTFRPSASSGSSFLSSPVKKKK